MGWLCVFLPWESLRTAPRKYAPDLIWRWNPSFETANEPMLCSTSAVVKTNGLDTTRILSISGDTNICINWFEFGVRDTKSMPLPILVQLRTLRRSTMNRNTVMEVSQKEKLLGFGRGSGIKCDKQNRRINEMHAYKFLDRSEVPFIFLHPVRSGFAGMGQWWFGFVKSECSNLTYWFLSNYLWPRKWIRVLKT